MRRDNGGRRIVYERDARVVLPLSVRTTCRRDENGRRISRGRPRARKRRIDAITRRFGFRVCFGFFALFSFVFFSFLVFCFSHLFLFYFPFSRHRLPSLATRRGQRGQRDIRQLPQRAARAVASRLRMQSRPVIWHGCRPTNRFTILTINPTILALPPDSPLPAPPSDPRHRRFCTAAISPVLIGRRGARTIKCICAHTHTHIYAFTFTRCCTLPPLVPLDRRT